MIPLDQPDESSIQEILARIDKYSEEDELNCGACGYNSCREKAIAVYQGIAEVEMCIPYLLSQKSECYLKLSDTFETVNNLNEQLNAIFESSYDGMIVCDAEGKIIKANSAWRNMVGIEEIPETAKELEDGRTVFSFRCAVGSEGEAESHVFTGVSKRKKFIATGNPIYSDKNEVVGVVTNIRDIAELSRLTHNVLKKNKKEAASYAGIITKSQEFGKVFELAAQAAKFKSTVLLLGETGVGKDVIASLIHNLSPLKDGPYIKVNCGAILKIYRNRSFLGMNMGPLPEPIKMAKPIF